MYPLSREEREEMCEFINKQLRKGYIRLSKSPQTAPVFFVGKKISKISYLLVVILELSGVLEV